MLLTTRISSGIMPYCHPAAFPVQAQSPPWFTSLSQYCYGWQKFNSPREMNVDRIEKNSVQTFHEWFGIDFEAETDWQTMVRILDDGIGFLFHELVGQACAAQMRKRYNEDLVWDVSQPLFLTWIQDPHTNNLVLQVRFRGALQYRPCQPATSVTSGGSSQAAYAQLYGTPSPAVPGVAYELKVSYVEPEDEVDEPVIQENLKENEHGRRYGL